jgi:hypothetical protein
MKDIMDIKDVANIEELENEYDLQKASLSPIPIGRMGRTVKKV